MTLAAGRVPWRVTVKPKPPTLPARICVQARWKSQHIPSQQKDRQDGVGRERLFTNEYSTIRDNYEIPRYPIVFAHGLLGFDELHLVGKVLPGIKYWRGIVDEFRRRGIEVIIAAVPPSSSIQDRAAVLGETIAKQAKGQNVNIIAGLDARYMISRLRPDNVNVKSLTTITTPHRGSAFSDHIIEGLGPRHLAKIRRFLESLGYETNAFTQLTTEYLENEFNPQVLDVDGVRPGLWSTLKFAHDIVERREGSKNDGLVSVRSSRWGTYKGTLEGVSHLDVINWTNWTSRVLSLFGETKKFNAIAFYLDIADMLAKEDL